ncbi:hypothetical protein ASF17_14990 [Frigoribacterium sp. Leaf263]|uniref:hypothetical protein n=1 Tax=Frigoribacterium sp. Leaf263 TaxID=1736313 RepID=UPI0006FD32CB|nr:hypothetical protein [Frigoribacterium sp. Leaf263]KQO79624.1 hypothetical protein ASF17_14990 [Frigoribacterium sp. Leaf263]
MLRAEILGLVTTTATKVAAVVALLGLVMTQLVFVVLLPALATGQVGPGAEALGDDLPVVDLTAAATQLDALSPLGTTLGGGSIGLALVAVVLLGVLAGTSDDRHGGIVGAVLASPRRSRVVVAKATAVGAGATVVGIVLAIVSLLTLIGSLALTATPFTAATGAVVATSARGVLAITCLAVIGLAVGILCRSQLTGVLVTIGALVAEPIVAAVAQLVGGGAAASWTQFLPVALAQSVIHGGAGTVGGGVAIAALLALTAVALVAASVALSRRDV